MKRRLIVVLAFAVGLGACRPLISPFSPAAYEQAVSIKIDGLALMDKATEPYEKHAAEAEAMQLRMEKAWEYARWQDHNEISTREWDVMKSTAPTHGLLGNFFERWREKKTLKPAAIGDSKKIVSIGFDKIIQLENGKIKPGEK